MFNLIKEKINGFIDSITRKKKEPPKEEKEDKIAKLAEEKGGVEAKEKGKEEKPGLKEERPRLELSLTKKITSIITGETTLSKEDVRKALDDFELGMLESDVALEVAELLCRRLEEKLVGRRIKRGEEGRIVEDEMKKLLMEIFSKNKQFSLTDFMKRAGRPVKILFFGVNGSGKTTTIAKVAKLLRGQGLSVVMVAADTFRAAAIEQLEIHGKRLDINVIKKQYGSDAASVAYDGVMFAKSNNIDVVLIDSSGRQENNVNLMNELKKIVRVINPDLKIFVGESIAGNAIVNQVKTFDAELGLDGVIMTKIDCDPKGGSLLSVCWVVNTPVIYLGNGQSYNSLEQFSPEKIVSQLVG